MSDRNQYDAWFQVVAGALIAGLCGVCTFNVVTGQDDYGFNVLGWVIGGAPTVMGLVFVGLGVRNLRR